MISQKNDEDDDIEIISLGEEYGTDKFVKKYCIEFGLNYLEFIPRYKKWNSKCVEKPYLFNRQYSPKYIFINYAQFIKYCDDFIFFSEGNNRKEENKLLESIKKSQKNLIIVE